MAESTIVVALGLVREKGYRYFLDGNGSVVRQETMGAKTREVVKLEVFTPEKGYFYFLTADGSIARTIRTGRKKKEDGQNAETAAVGAA